MNILSRKLLCWSLLFGAMDRVRRRWSLPIQAIRVLLSLTSWLFQHDLVAAPFKEIFCCADYNSFSLFGEKKIKNVYNVVLVHEFYKLKSKNVQVESWFIVWVNFKLWFKSAWTIICLFFVKIVSQPWKSSCTNCWLVTRP